MKHYLELHGNSEDMLLFTSHNLGRLYDRICAISGNEPDRATRGDLSKLTDYYFNTNYPKEINIELTKDMAQDALDIAKTVNKWMDSLMEQEQRT